MRFLQQERERERKRKLSEGTSNRLPIQSYDNYFAQPLRTRYTNENHSRTCFPFFFFFFPLLPSLEPVPVLPKLSCLSENNNLHNKQDE